MNSLGTQYIAEFINCQTQKLSDQSFLETSVKDALEASGLHVVKFFSHHFDPDGITLIAIISESHFAMHTYPESNLVSLDLYTCTNGEKHAKFIHELEKVLKPESIRNAEINRGNPIDFKNQNWITNYSEHGFETRYYIKERIYTKQTEFQLIEIIDNKDFGKMLFLDKDLQLAQTDVDLYNKALVDPIRHEAENVLVLGGGDGGVLNEIIKHNPKHVTLVDIDPDVVSASRQFLPEVCGDAFDQPNVEIVHLDVFDFFKNGKQFDAIVYDLTMYPEKHTALNRKTYLSNLFAKVKAALKPAAILSIHVGSGLDTASFQLFQSIMRDLNLQVKITKVYIPSFCEERAFADLKKY